MVGVGEHDGVRSVVGCLDLMQYAADVPVVRDVRVHHAIGDRHRDEHIVFRGIVGHRGAADGSGRFHHLVHVGMAAGAGVEGDLREVRDAEFVETDRHAIRAAAFGHRHVTGVRRQCRDGAGNAVRGDEAADRAHRRAEHARLVRIAVLRVVLGGGEGHHAGVLAVFVGEFGDAIACRAVGDRRPGIVEHAGEGDACDTQFAVIHRDDDRHCVLRARVVEAFCRAGGRRDLRQLVRVGSRLGEGDVAQGHVLGAVRSAPVRQCLAQCVVAVGVNVGNGAGVGQPLVGGAGRQRRSPCRVQSELERIVATRIGWQSFDRFAHGDEVLRLQGDAVRLVQVDRRRLGDS